MHNTLEHNETLLNNKPSDLGCGKRAHTNTHTHTYYTYRELQSPTERAHAKAKKLWRHVAAFKKEKKEAEQFFNSFTRLVGAFILHS